VNYRLTVAQLTPIPPEEIGRRVQAMMYEPHRTGLNEVGEERETRRIEVTLTEDEYAAVKAALMEVWK